MSRELTIGFVGLGNMGRPMAANLVKAGLRVVVFDAIQHAAQSFVTEFGGELASSAASFSDVDVVVTMLPTGIDVANALLDSPDPIAASLRKGTVVVDMSSADPVGTRALGERLARLDIDLVDAPVSGGVPRAQSGTLAIMVGGASQAIETVRPVLQLLGDRIFDVGSLGCGHAMKALNNFVAGTAFVACSEAVLVGERFGLDPTVMMDVMNVSTGRCFNTEMVMKQHVISGEFASGFALGLLTKDVGIAASLASAVGHADPLSKVVTERLAGARDALGAHVDHTRAAAHWAAPLSL
jgi:3-hydroxyisobutyrate dehydrogenase